MDEGDLEHYNQREGGRWKKAGGEELAGNVIDVLFWQDLFLSGWPGRRSQWECGWGFSPPGDQERVDSRNEVGLSRSEMLSGK